MKKLKFKTFNIVMDYLAYENNTNNKLEEWQKDNKKREFVEIKIIEDSNRSLWLYVIYTEDETNKSTAK